VRIALIVPGFSRSADEYAIPALQMLACSLAQRCDVEVFSLRYPETGSYTICELRHWATGGGTRMGVGSLRVWLDTVRAIVACHRRQPFDLLHAFWLDEPAFVAALVGTAIRRPVLASAGGGELVYFPELDYGTQRSPWRRLLIRCAVRRAALVTAGSPYQRALCLRLGIPPEKVRLAPLGVDVGHFRPAAATPTRPTVVQAASLVSVKQQGLLLEAVAQARTAVPGLQLLVAGAGPEAASLRIRAEQLGLDGQVSWLGAVAHRAMPAFYGRGHVYVQTSRHESQGMAVLEAMACGLPVLGTPVGLLPEVAALPPSDSPERLAEQIATVVDDKAGWAGRSAAARGRAEDAYSLPATTERFLELAARCTR
jgi:glycosyltransferase involved in cell wall biosynthesis